MCIHWGTLILLHTVYNYFHNSRDCPRPAKPKIFTILSLTEKGCQTPMYG